ncbi:MAG: hypothetical protein JKY94_06555 [Rhodobacteraceae bacterium]|nr:hypothetical protein [Paracoccaceae bacterium]
MVSLIKAGKTPANVANLATRPKGLDLKGLTLLGLFGPTDSLTALVRLPGGKMKRVNTGDRLGGGVVLGIDMDGLVLSQFGQTQRLFLPG